MRPLAEDTVFDRLVRFVFGAAVGAGLCVLVLTSCYFIIGHVHAPLLSVAVAATVGGVLAVRRVPKA